ncbi:MAG TPA: stress-responsive transcriptional regulator [Cytophagales bacterium]|nr:stress-responsive transcriptional regulator [Cytophagales bacterium]
MDHMASKKLVRSKDRIIGGVCGGIAEWIGWDPTWVRLLYIILSVATAFSGLLVYIILWIVMPDSY